MKKWKKGLAVSLSLALALTSASVAQTQTAEAAGSVTLYVGKTAKLRVIGAKKVKWRSNKKSVATVSSKGVVRGKKAGTAKITAIVKKPKVKKKKYTWRVRVKGMSPVRRTATVTPYVPPAPKTPVATPTPVVTPAPNVSSNTDTVSNSVLASNMGITTQTCAYGSEVLLTVTNSNSITVPYYTINYQLKDSSGAVLETGNDWGYSIAPGASQCIAVFVGSENAKKIDASKSVVSITADASYSYTDRSAAVSLAYAKDADGEKFALTYTNAHTDSVQGTSVFLFYDANNKLVAVADTAFYLQAGETAFDEIRIPLDDDYNTIDYSRVDVYTYAHSYEA